MNQLNPVIAQALAPWTPPTICRRCDDVIDAEAHTLGDCDAAQQNAAIAADLAYNQDKAHRRNNDDFARALKFQAQQMDCGVLA